MAGPALQYWGRVCEIPFAHEGQSTTHKGLVVLAGPLCDLGWLVTAAADLAPRLRVLEDAIAWSYGLLTPKQ